jgi:poly-gamma-glutamate capsule biosynthesis protein CapA/YwtB (metallophosphatase superfamily)
MPPLTFTATGDAMLFRRVSPIKDPNFLALLGLIRGADAAFTNLEFTTPRYPYVPAPFRRVPLFGQVFALDELKWCGFNLFNTANNHQGDWTFLGTIDTTEELKARGMIYAGSGRSLGEARAPGYLDTAAGRVALLGATSHTVNLASEHRTGMTGRPGINPLRFETDFYLDAEGMAALRKVDQSLGLAAVRERRTTFDAVYDNLEFKEQGSTFTFMGQSFIQSDQSAIRTRAKKRDLEDIGRWIGEARRQADLVVMSIHASEGVNNDSGTTPEPADFIIEAARSFIDAGADVVVGHGPNMLRAIELHQGKPIFYSLGNIFATLESMPVFPSELYERYSLSPNATPADVFDLRTRDEQGKPKGWHVDRRIWQTALPICRLEDGRFTSIELHPVKISLECPRGQRGVPGLASAEEGEEILDHWAQLSAAFGTKLSIEKTGPRAVGRVAL